jgi:hypothetical protein
LYSECTFTDSIHSLYSVVSHHLTKHHWSYETNRGWKKTRADLQRKKT